MNPKKLISKSVIYPIVIAVLLAIAIVLPAFQRTEVDAAAVSRGTVREYVFEEETRTRLDVLRKVSSPITATVMRIEHNVGDTVDAGEVLTTVEDDEIINAINASKARVQELEARIEGLDTKVPKEAELAAAAEAVVAAEQVKKVAQTEKNKAQQELDYRQKQYARIKQAFEQDAISEEDYDLARHEYEIAQRDEAIGRLNVTLGEITKRIMELRRQAMEDSLADVDHLEKAYSYQIDQIRAELATLFHQAEKTYIKSPVTGVITSKHLDSEAFVEAGRPLMEIGDLDSIEIKSDVLSADIHRVVPGQDVIIEGAILDDKYIDATVNYIYPHGFTKISALGVEQQRFRVIIDFDNTERQLPPGADLDARIIVEQRDDVLYIPQAAVFTTAQGPAVFRVSNGRARLTHVTLGLSSEEIVEITEGLDEDNLIIIRPPIELEPDDRVIVRDANQ